MHFPDDLKYTKSHEWARQDGARVRSGLTEYAQKELSDVVYVELPEVGRKVRQGEAIAVVESVKAAFDIYAAVNGEIAAVNKDTESDPALINKDCYGGGWLFEFLPEGDSGMDALLDKAAYSECVNASWKMSPKAGIIWSAFRTKTTRAPPVYKMHMIGTK